MKLNNKAQRFGGRVTETTTYNGAPAYRQSADLELVRLVVTCMFGEPKFYESGDDRITRMNELVSELVRTGKADFVAKLGVYARKVMNMRTVSIALQVILAKQLRNHNVKLPLLRKAITATISRADEITDTYAYALSEFGSKNKVPQAIKKGVADSFYKFDEYQFAKYNRGTEVKLRDVLRITHAKPQNHKQNIIFNRIINDELKTPDTWETKISTEGSNTENWQEVANNPKTGFMALLRNLRNFVNHDVDLTKVISRLTNEEEVRKSKQLPYRFYTAYKELGGDIGSISYSSYDTIKVNGKLLAALETAFDISIDNIPDLGDTILVVDVSGSMASPISNKSTIRMVELAAVYASAVWSASVRRGRDSMIVAFADIGKVITPRSHRSTALSVATSILDEVNRIGYGTNVNSAWQAAKNAKLTGNTIMLFTDMQFNRFKSWNGRSELEPENYGVANNSTNKVLFDLQGYAANPFTEISGWTQLSGWSDKVFDLLTTSDKSDEIIRTVNNYTF